MADKNDDKEPAEGAEGEEGGEKKEGAKKPAFKLSAGIVAILKTVLMYLGVAIISFAVAFIVAHKSGGQKSETKEQLVVNDPSTGDVIEKIPKGADWALEDMVLNTADEDERHMLRAKLIVSYDKEDKTILMELNDRKSQIHSEVLKILGSKKYLEINTTPKQEEVIREIKTRIQLIVDHPGIIEVFVRDFTVH
jgi:flagellar basal body-associated protein FliL